MDAPSAPPTTMTCEAVGADSGPKVRQRRRPLVLVEFPDLPDWMKDNEYITAKYRPHMDRWADCLRTGFFNLHNESVNIWTHAIGFVFFLCLTVYTVVHLTSVNGHFASTITRSIEQYSLNAVNMLHYAEDALYGTLRHTPASFQSGKDAYKGALESLGAPGQMLLSVENALLRRFGSASMSSGAEASKELLQRAFSALLQEHMIGMLPMLFGATFCCLSSTLFHLVSVHSLHVVRIFSRLDYAGIVLLIAGHSMMGSYYVFYCNRRLALAYNVFEAVAAAPVLAAFFYRKFESPEFRTSRTLIFLLFGVVSTTPVVHSGIAYQFADPEWLSHVSFLAVAVFFYLLGALFFSTRWPECSAPGRFNLFCSSHQLMHVCVMIGAFLHWYGSYMSLQYRLKYGCTVSLPSSVFATFTGAQEAGTTAA